MQAYIKRTPERQLRRPFYARVSGEILIYQYFLRR